MAEDHPHTHKPTIGTTYSSHDNPKPFVRYGDTTAYIRTWGPFRKNAVVRALAEAKYRHDEGTRKYLKKLARTRRREERRDRFIDEQRERFEQAIEKQNLVEPVKEPAGNGTTFTFTTTAPDFLSGAVLTYQQLSQERARQQSKDAVAEQEAKIVGNLIGNRFASELSAIPDPP